jgi:hypothetical protein
VDVNECFGGFEDPPYYAERYGQQQQVNTLNPNPKTLSKHLSENSLQKLWTAADPG